MPVPRLTQTRCDSPRPGAEPPLGPGGGVGVVLDHHRQPQPRLIASRSGSLRQDRCGANSTVARSASMKPAAPMPTAWISCRSARSSTASTIVSSTTCGLLLRSGVSRRTWSRTSPSCVTTPAATLVPPMSTPTVSSCGGQRAHPQGARRLVPQRPPEQGRTSLGHDGDSTVGRTPVRPPARVGRARHGVGYCRRSSGVPDRGRQHPARAVRLATHEADRVAGLRPARLEHRHDHVRHGLGLEQAAGLRVVVGGGIAVGDAAPEGGIRPVSRRRWLSRRPRTRCAPDQERPPRRRCRTRGSRTAGRR